MTAYEQRFPNDAEYRKRYTEEASKFYIDKMMKLIGDDKTRINELSGFVPGLILPNHMMYRIGTLVNQDQIRSYEFLIEYNITKPSEGIYYGCRGITKEGADHEHTIKLFREDWANIKWLLCQVLNNIFPDKDFSSRFKMTDNANTNTYWLFWISLYEDEDINNVGVVATKKIRDVFELYLEGKLGNALVFPTPKQIIPVTAFYESNYQDLLSKVKDRDRFKQLLQRLEEEGWIERLPTKLYEHAWIFKGIGKKNLINDFTTIIHYLKSKGFFIDGIPWTSLENLFMKYDGLALANLKENATHKKHDRTKFWNEKLDQLLSI